MRICFFNQILNRVVLTWLVLSCGWWIQAQDPVRIGSKSFTESVVLGEMLCTLARHEHLPVHHRSELGGTQFLWQALLRE